MTQKTDYRREAYNLRDRGISTVPLKTDKSKLPKIKWRHLQERFMTDAEIEKDCIDCGGLSAITGSVSQLLCLDFDTGKSVLDQNTWKEFMSQVPEEMKRRFFVNQSRSGGWHIWLRVDFTDKSRKITHKTLTIPEICSKYEAALKNKLDPQKVSAAILNNPRACLVESRFQGSYAVMCHEQYKRIYGKEIQKFSKEEVDFLLTILYSLDCGFRKPSKISMDEGNYKILREYNDDTTAQEVADMMVDTGLYEFAGIKQNGDIMLKRIGSNNKYSSVVFSDTALTHDFGISNLFADDKGTHSAFEVYCACNNLTQEEAIEKLKNGK